MTSQSTDHSHSATNEQPTESPYSPNHPISIPEALSLPHIARIDPHRPTTAMSTSKTTPKSANLCLHASFSNPNMIEQSGRLPPPTASLICESLPTKYGPWDLSTLQSKVLDLWGTLSCCHHRHHHPQLPHSSSTPNSAK